MHVVVNLVKFSQTVCYRAAAMRPRYCDQQSVCLCPSVKRVNCDKTKETHVLIPYESSMHLVLRQEERLVGMSTCTLNFGPNWPTSSKTAISNPHSFLALQP